MGCKPKFVLYENKAEKDGTGKDIFGLSVKREAGRPCLEFFIGAPLLRAFQQRFCWEYLKMFPVT